VCARVQTQAARRRSLIQADYAGSNRPARSSHHPKELRMNKDQSDGRVKEVKGKVKEVAGRITGDKTLENKGKLQNAGGKVQAGYGDAKADLKKAAKDLTK
jgi:uncharacterized protein YjbJ (UPF0337 family)